MKTTGNSFSVMENKVYRESVYSNNSCYIWTGDLFGAGSLEIKKRKPGKMSELLNVVSKVEEYILTVFNSLNVSLHKKISLYASV